eukprot:4549052-Amphidinium_carterae.2
MFPVEPTNDYHHCKNAILQGHTGKYLFASSPDPCYISDQIESPQKCKSAPALCHGVLRLM